MKPLPQLKMHDSCFAQNYYYIKFEYLTGHLPIDNVTLIPSVFSKYAEIDSTISIKKYILIAPVKQKLTKNGTEIIIYHDLL